MKNHWSMLLLIVLIGSIAGRSTAQERLFVFSHGDDATQIAAFDEVTIVSPEDATFARLRGAPPADTTYAWEVNVKDADGNAVDAADAGVSAERDKPELKLDELKEKLTYELTFKRTLNGAAPVTLRATIQVPPDGAPAPIRTAVTYPDAQAESAEEAADSGAEETEGGEESRVAAPPANLAEATQDINQRLNAARLWADAVQVAAGKQIDPIVDLDFFHEKLENGPAGELRKGVAWLDSRRVLTIEELYRQLLLAAEDAAAESSTEGAWSQWEAKRNLFERRMNAGISEGGINLPDEIQQMWKAFLDAWEAEVKSKSLSTSRIADALTEAAVAIVGIVAGIDDKAIEAALAGGAPRGSAGQPSQGSATGGAYPRYSHAAIRHLRIMNRIHRRHAVRRARHGY